MNESALPTRLMSADSDEAEAANTVPLDRTAFGDVYASHRDVVFRYLRARTSDEEEAFDLTALTFERALEALERYRPSGGGIRAWLLRIARNAAIDHSRKERLLVRGLPPEGLFPSVASAEDLVVAADERRRIRRLVAQLPDPQRDAIALRYAAGMTARGISEVIGRREEATQKLLSRALVRLKEAYDNEQ
jgi:RNA polymerase sigma-70 factor (ECF subfamily)